MQYTYTKYDNIKLHILNMVITSIVLDQVWIIWYPPTISGFCIYDGEGLKIPNI